MGTLRKVDDEDATEDLETNGARFDIETEEGTFKIILPVLDREPAPER